MNRKQQRILATRPEAMVRYRLTGRLPQTVTPDSPLIRLLRRIAPRDRLRICGLTVDRRLGYTGSRQFHNAEQALRWIAPEPDMQPNSWPAKSWRDKRFHRVLDLADLKECCASMPEGMVVR